MPLTTSTEYQEQIVEDLRLDQADPVLGTDGTNAILVSEWWDSFASADLIDPYLLVNGPHLRFLKTKRRAIDKLVQDGRKTGITFNDSGAGIQQSNNERIKTLTDAREALSKEIDTYQLTAGASRSAALNALQATTPYPNPYGGPDGSGSLYRGGPYAPWGYGDRGRGC